MAWRERTKSFLFFLFQPCGVWKLFAFDILASQRKFIYSKILHSHNWNISRKDLCWKYEPKFSIFLKFHYFEFSACLFGFCALSNATARWQAGGRVAGVKRVGCIFRKTNKEELEKQNFHFQIAAKFPCEDFPWNSQLHFLNQVGWHVKDLMELQWTILIWNWNLSTWKASSLPVSIQFHPATIQVFLQLSLISSQNN